MKESPAGMRVFGGELEVALKDALLLVKSANWRRRKVCVFFDLRAKGAKKRKGASIFALRRLSEVEEARIVEMGNWEVEGRARTGRG